MDKMYSIIIVDDERIILEGLTQTYDWHEAGFDVIGTAMDGRTAVEKIVRLKPDVVMTDIRMKNMDGLELIKEVKAYEKNIEFIVISAFRDFEYAQQACQLSIFSYLLKPFSNLEFKNTMQTLKNLLDNKKRENRMRDLFIEYKNDILSIQIKNFLVWGASIDSNKLYMNEIENKIDENTLLCCICVDIELATNILIDISTQRYAQFRLICGRLSSCFKFIRVDLPDGRMMLIACNFGNENFNKKYVHDNLTTIVNCLEEEGYLYLISYGEVLNGFNGMTTSYNQAITGIEFTYESDSEKILAYKSKIGTKSRSYTYPKVQEQNVLAAIRLNEYESIKYAVSEFNSTLNCIEANHSFRVNCFHQLCLTVGSLFMDLYAVEGETLEVLYTLNTNLDYISDEDLPLVISDTFIKINSTYNENIYKETTALSRSYLNNAIKYIDSKLSDYELSIVEVSNHLHLNPIYFGRMFKNCVGKTFKEYLTQKRVEMAKNLLETTIIQVSEVGFTVGINNPSYFSTQFKRFTGKSPTEYRKC